MHINSVLIILFSIATAVALAARRFKVPYTVALVLAGLAIGASKVLQAPPLTKEWLFAAVLPGLVFEAAFHLDLSKLWEQRWAVLALAVPGLVVAVLLTAGMLVPALQVLGPEAAFSWMQALLFAALIVATDPIAVVAIFKGMGTPKRLAVLVEGESLLNDGVGVVLFGLVLTGAAQGQFSVLGAAGDFLRVACLGAALGGAAGYLASQLIRRIDDPMVELTLTIIAAYGSFALAEDLQTSGVIATAVAGIFCGNGAARRGMSPSTKLAVETSWEYLAFALNSMVFLLIGFEVRLEALAGAWKAILLAYAVVLVARALVVYGVWALLRRSRVRMPWSWAAIVTWAGLRGALSMVLVLSLAEAFPGREMMVSVTFGVVILSILLQGLTVGPLMRRLGVVGVRTAEEESYELSRARLQAAAAAMDEIVTLRAERGAPKALLDALEGEYRDRATRAETELKALHVATTVLRENVASALRRRLVLRERDTVMQAAHKGEIGAANLGRLLADLDAQLEEGA